jgi:hypothetical protein
MRGDDSADDVSHTLMSGSGRLYPEIPIPARPLAKPAPAHEAPKHHDHSDTDARILAAVKAAGRTIGQHGLTVDELATVLNLDVVSVAPRVHALEHKTHELVDSGIKRRTRRGALARVLSVPETQPSLGL